MSLHPFDMLMELPPEAIRLDCAALHMARDAYPDLNVLACLEQLDLLADAVKATRPGLSAVGRFEAMREVLAGQEGFGGNQDDYYDPQNSYLNRVLERRLGIPISLSILWLEIGRRLNWPVFGVGFPGRFLVRFDDPDRFLVADPFADGKPVSEEDCQNLLDEQFSGKVKFDAKMLDPVGVSAILTRSLNNLRAIYRANHDWDRLDAVLQRLTTIEPSNEDHRIELVAIRHRMGPLCGTYFELPGLLNHQPDSDDDRRHVRELNQLRAMIASLN
ncbi:MAG: hypothetical protein HZB38_03120 [Planctomycetes bacterium]|nr:hypothetical protein [Planctomycetota bacterium]